MRIESPAADVLDALRDQVEHWADIEWIGGRVTDDALVAVVRRRGDAGAATLEGFRLLVDQQDLLQDAELRASTVVDALVAIVQASDTPVPLPVDWAADVVDDPAAVRWRGDAVAQFARAALSQLHSSAQGCFGSPL